ncbi:MAG: toxic anion resistance protein [Asticcacaulis sp.]
MSADEKTGQSQTDGQVLKTQDTNEVSVQTPPIDAARIQRIRTSITLSSPDDLAHYGDRAEREAQEAIARLVSEVRGADQAEILDRLRLIRDQLTPMLPQDLAKPVGFGALFGARRKRLNRFRDQYKRVAATVDSLTGEIAERLDRISHKHDAMESLHRQCQDFILELDAYREAARSWIAQNAPRETGLRVVPGDVTPLPEPQAYAGAVRAMHVADLLESEPRDVDLADNVIVLRPERVKRTSHPTLVGELVQSPPTLEITLQATPKLTQRVARLDALRDLALRELPLVRQVQNVDLRLLKALKPILGTLQEWQSTWSDRLGLSGRKVKHSFRPDTDALIAVRSAVLDLIEALETEIQTAQQRRQQAEIRLQSLARSVRPAQS